MRESSLPRRAFIHRYVDLPEGLGIRLPLRLFTWRYDDFAEVRTSESAAITAPARAASSSPSVFCYRAFSPRRLKRLVALPDDGCVSRDTRSR